MVEEIDGQHYELFPPTQCDRRTESARSVRHGVRLRHTNRPNGRRGAEHSARVQVDIFYQYVNKIVSLLIQLIEQKHR